MSIGASMRPARKHSGKFQYHSLAKGIRHGLAILAVGGTLISTQGFPAGGVIELSALNGAASDGGTPGVIINGITDNGANYTVSNAGDVNGDGIADLLIGNSTASPNGSASGQTYMVFGQSDTTLPDVIELSVLNGAFSDGGTPGLTINGINADDNSGDSVSYSGDVNGDGMADLLVGADDADPNGINSGQTYVVFGQSGGALPLVIELSVLNGAISDGGTPGLNINGINAFDSSGNSVSNAGDVNGDGIADLLRHQLTVITLVKPMWCLDKVVLRYQR